MTLPFGTKLIKKKGGDKMTQKRKRGGQNLRTSAKKRDSLNSYLKTQMLKLRSLLTTIEKRLTTKHKNAQNKYDKNGVYQLTYLNCEKKYTEQTRKPCKVRFQEHLRDFKYGSNRPKFTQHLLENKHEIGPMESIMYTIHVTKKGKIMDTEKFYIYREAEASNQLNKLTVQNNPVFETVVHEDPTVGSGSSQTASLGKNSVVGSCSPRWKWKLHQDRRPSTTTQGSAAFGTKRTVSNNTVKPMPHI
jgi:hypothetical protein